MHLKLFNTRLSADNTSSDQEVINSFMNTVTVKKTATQFVPGNPDFWSILVFYENQNGATKETKTEKPPSITEADLNEEERNIYTALRLWRKDRAAEINMPDFMVCHNATLMHISKEKPQDLISLGTIKGMGGQKVVKYGEDIIAILNAF